MADCLWIQINVVGTGMQISDNELSSEQKLLWRTWGEKSRRVDRLVEKRMTVLFLATGVILLACVLYYALRAKASSDPSQQYPAASTPIVRFHMRHGRNLGSDEARQKSYDSAGPTRG